MGRTRTIASLLLGTALVLTVSINTPRTVQASTVNNAPLEMGSLSSPSANLSQVATSIVTPTATTVYWGALVGTSTSVQAPVATSFQAGGAFYNFEQRTQKKM